MNIHKSNMDKDMHNDIMIINGSPRAPKSNSKLYSEIFSGYCKRSTRYFNLTKNNHADLCKEIGNYNELILVFPLYADSLPVGLLNFLKYMEMNPPAKKPVISILINCGFLEYTQNETAVRMIRFFCKTNGYKIGSVLMLGSGEAILKTPFRYVAKRAIRKFADTFDKGSYDVIKATMPLSKWLFKVAASQYWKRYGEKFGVSKKEMQTMKIE